VAYSLRLDNASHVIVENILIDGDAWTREARNPIVVPETSDHIALRSIELRDYPHATGCFIGGGSGTNIASDILVYNCHFHDLNDWQALAETRIHGVVVRHATARIWILDCRGEFLGEDGVQINAGGTPVATDVYVGRCLFHHNREDAVDVKGSSRVILSQNECFGFRPSSTSVGNAFVIHEDDGVPQDVWVLFNEIHDCERGMTLNMAGRTYLVGNLLYDIHHLTGDQAGGPDNITRKGLAISIRRSDDVLVYNNTIVDADAGISAQGVSTYPNAGVDMVNNLVALDDNAEDYRHIIMANDSAFGGRCDFHHNLLDHTTQPSFIRWADNGQYTVASFIAAFAPAKGDGLIDQAPALAGDYQPTGSSPAVDAGAPITVYSSVFAADFFGLDIAVDFYGRPRTAGSIDIGAFEYDGN
jgi:hypothetical protein